MNAENTIGESSCFQKVRSTFGLHMFEDVLRYSGFPRHVCRSSRMFSNLGDVQGGFCPGSRDDAPAFPWVRVAIQFPQPQIQIERLQTSFPKQMFQAENPKRTFPSDHSQATNPQATIPKLEFPGDSFHTKVIKRK